MEEENAIQKSSNDDQSSNLDEEQSWSREDTQEEGEEEKEEEEDDNTDVDFYNNDNEDEVVIISEEGAKALTPEKKAISSFTSGTETTRTSNIIHFFNYKSTIWVTSKQYRQEAAQLLLHDFFFLTPLAIQRLFEYKKFHYFPTFQLVVDTLTVDENPENQRKRSQPQQYPDSVLQVVAYEKPLKPSQRQSLRELFATISSEFLRMNLLQHHNSSTESSSSYTIPSLSEFMHSYSSEHPLSRPIRQILVKDRILMDEVKFLKTQHAPLFAILTQQNRSTCQCCFSEYELDDMVQCNEGHIFCTLCLKKHTEEEVFGKGKAYLKCMWHEEKQSCGTELFPTQTKTNESNKNDTKKILTRSEKSTKQDCDSTFHRSQLIKALPFKVLEKYDEMQFLDNLKKAEIPDLWCVR